MNKRYEHAQIGYLVLTVVAAAMVLIGVILATAGMSWAGIAVLVILGMVLVLFSGLTVTIWDDTLEVRFGPGLIRKRFKLQDIESWQIVKNPWYYGWGIRLTPHGYLYNVSGFHAVEIKLRRGARYLIGTNVPRELEEALRQATEVWIK